jgi:hypothetical protein
MYWILLILYVAEGVAIPSPDPLVGARFGSSLAVFNNSVLVGTNRQDNKGNAFLFICDFDCKNTARFDIETSDDYPISISMYEDTVVVGGIGHVDVFSTSGELVQRLQPASYGIQYGISVGIHSHFLVVGAPLGINQDFVSSGVIFVYDRRSFARINVTSPRELREADHFGRSVASFGNYILIGAPQGNAAYLLFCEKTCQSKVRLTGLPDSRFGMVVTMSNQMIVIGAPLSSSVHVFDLEGREISVVTKGDLGSVVAISEQRVLMGSPKRQLVYIFICTDSCELDSILVDLELDENFGYSVGGHLDKTFAGAPTWNDQGAFFVM